MFGVYEYILDMFEHRPIIVVHLIESIIFLVINYVNLATILYENTQISMVAQENIHNLHKVFVFQSDKRLSESVSLNN